MRIFSLVISLVLCSTLVAKARYAQGEEAVIGIAESPASAQLPIRDKFHVIRARPLDRLGCHWQEHAPSSSNFCLIDSTSDDPIPQGMPSLLFDKTGAEDIEAQQFVTVIYVDEYAQSRSLPPKQYTLEQRFAMSLARGSPERIRGHSYGGCSYDGTFYSCGDPLSSIIRNVQNALR